MRRFSRPLGTTLVLVGVLLVALGVAWQVGIVPGSQVAVPPPVALEQPPPPPTMDAVVRAVPTPVPTVPASPQPAPAPSPAVSPVALPSPSPAPTTAPSPTPARPEPGYAVRLRIPAIKLDTTVEQAGIVTDARGQPEWQTLPFIAVHYGDLTAKIGEVGNAVIAGHVVTLNEGNVFRFLYQVTPGDEVLVEDDHGRERRYLVDDVKLVPPSAVEVMAPTPEERLTLITCGGTFNSVTREFSDRLIVVAHPADDGASMPARASLH